MEQTLDFFDIQTSSQNREKSEITPQCEKNTHFIVVTKIENNRMDSSSSNIIEIIESKTELETVSSSDSNLSEVVETNQPMKIKRIECPSLLNLSTDQRCSPSSSNQSMTPPKLSPIDVFIPITFPQFNLELVKKEPIGSQLIDSDYTEKTNTTEHDQCVVKMENISAKEAASSNKPQCRRRWDCDRSMSQIEHQSVKRQKSMDDQYVKIKREKISEELNLKGILLRILCNFLTFNGNLPEENGNHFLNNFIS